MKIITGGLEYPVAAIPSLGERTVRLPLEAVPEVIGETVTLTDNDSAELCPPWTVADWLRCYLDGNTLVLTQMPEAVAEEPPLDEIKAERVAQSKSGLAAYLVGHPLTWTDGKQYSVTEEKQALLMGNIAAYQLEVQGNPAAEITWNATGEECVEWAFADLCALAVAVKAYVKPLVAYQQAKEVEIMACGTVEAVAAVVVDYVAVGGNA